MSHQIHLIRTGLETANSCTAGVPVPSSLRWQGVSMRIVDVTLPRIAIIGPLTAAVTIGASTFDLPAIYSMDQLVHFFDDILYNGVRAAYAFWSNSEFELCTVPAMTFAATLGGFLKFPVTVPAGTCVSSHIGIAELDREHTGYSVQMIGSGVRGITTDATTFELSETVALLGHDADCSKTPWLQFVGTPLSFYASVFFRNFDGSIGPYPVPLPDTETFEIVIEIK